MNSPTITHEQQSLNVHPKKWLALLGMMLAGVSPFGPTVWESSANGQRNGERGAVSLEQVLWFVAAGLSVAVVAGILWAQIRTQASTPINVPSAP
jgi:hypothetical protein